MPDMSDDEVQQMRVIFDEVVMASGGVTEVDASAVLTKPMLSAAMKTLGKMLTEQELDDVFRIADADGSGGVSFDEWCTISQMPDEAPSDIARAAIAEFIGVALFQFFGGLPMGDYAAAGNGLALVVLVYATASISGGHLNPAVSFGLFVTQQISFMKMLLYWIAQFAGGLCGASWVYAINNGQYGNLWGLATGLGCKSYTGTYSTTYGPDGGLAWPTSSGDDRSAAFWADANDKNEMIIGCNSCTLPLINYVQFGDHGGFLLPGQIFGIEFLATFVLVFTVFATAVDPRGAAGNAAPFAIGSSLWATASGIGGLTGGALNPARTLCPAIVFNCWTAYSTTYLGSSSSTQAATLVNAPARVNVLDPDNGISTYQWAYILAQFLAGACAGLVYKFLFLNRPDDGTPGPASVFKYTARDTVKAKAAMKAVGASKPPVAAPSITVIDHGRGTEQQVASEDQIHV